MEFRPWSISKLRVFRDCPHLWKLKYVDRAAQIPNEILEFGGYVHALIEGMLDGTALVPSTWLTQEQVARGRALANRVMDYDLTPDSLIGIETILALDHDWEPLRDLLGASKETAYSTRNRPRIGFLAKMDVIQDRDGEILIRDWKTGFPSDKDAWQIAIYGAIAAKFWPGRPITVRIEYLQAPAMSQESQIEPTDAALALEDLKAELARIEAMDEFPAVPGPACVTCRHVLACPYRDSGLLSCQNSATAERIALDLEHLEGQIKCKKLALRFWVDNGGQVAGWGYKERRSLSWDIPALVARMGGLDAAAAVLTVNGTKIKKAMKDPEIAALATPKTSLAFGKMKGDPDED
jgi:hypothetical protein